MAGLEPADLSRLKGATLPFAHTRSVMWRKAGGFEPPERFSASTVFKTVAVTQNLSAEPSVFGAHGWTRTSTTLGSKPSDFHQFAHTRIFGGVYR